MKYPKHRIRQKTPSVRAFFALFVIGLSPLICEANGAVTPRRELQSIFVEEVLLGAEYGGHEERVVRWVRSPVIFIKGGDRTDRRIILALMGELNELIKDSGVDIRIGDASTANIKIIFAPYAELSVVADSYGFEFVQGNEGFFWLDYGENFDLRFALILIAEELEGSYRKAFILQELVQALGPANDSQLMKSTIFYDVDDHDKPPTDLFPIDRKLLRFLYTYLKPGDGRTKVRQAFEKYWDRLD